MTDTNANIELFHAFQVEELESRLQNGFGGYGYGDPYYGCSLNIKS